jgi:hypothetical protein
MIEVPEVVGIDVTEEFQLEVVSFFEAELMSIEVGQSAYDLCLKRWNRLRSH